MKSGHPEPPVCRAEMWNVHSLVTKRGNSFHWRLSCAKKLLKFSFCNYKMLIIIRKKKKKNLNCCAVFSHSDLCGKIRTISWHKKKKNLLITFFSWTFLPSTKQSITASSRSDQGAAVIRQSGDTNVPSKLFYCTKKDEAHNSFIHQPRRLIINLPMSEELPVGNFDS